MSGLAYVFWHWRKAELAATAYEERLRSFHEALAETPSEGFTRSWSVSVRGLPWANEEGDAYEDWYLLQDSSAMDRLNEAAVTGSRQGSHDSAAAAAAGGAAGLYRLRLGTPGPVPGCAAWFAKPDGMPYDTLWRLLEEPVARAGAALWGRQMVLGPGPEFCLHAPVAIELPLPIVPRRASLRAVWPAVGAA